MLTITVGGTESYDEQSEEFIVIGGDKLQLEHSLVSLSKWESKHQKPFLGKGQKTPEEVYDYVRCMSLDEETPEELFLKLSEKNFKEINEYIESKQTATWFADTPAPRSSEVITNELIYYWMTAFQIPFECERWHLNRLFTLIQVANHKSQKPKKMSKAEIARRNRELNEQRKAQLGTSG